MLKCCLRWSPNRCLAAGFILLATTWSSLLCEFDFFIKVPRVLGSGVQHMLVVCLQASCLNPKTAPVLGVEGTLRQTEVTCGSVQDERDTYYARAEKVKFTMIFKARNLAFVWQNHIMHNVGGVGGSRFTSVVRPEWFSQIFSVDFEFSFCLCSGGNF